MTKTKIVALLSVIALLASLPLAVAFAQEGGEGEQTSPGGPPALPYKVVGNAMLDDGPAMEGTMVVAMVGDEKVGEGVVGMDGVFSVDIDTTMADAGAMVMFSLMTGEGRRNDGVHGRHLHGCHGRHCRQRRHSQPDGLLQRPGAAHGRAADSHAGAAARPGRSCRRGRC